MSPFGSTSLSLIPLLLLQALEFVMRSNAERRMRDLALESGSAAVAAIRNLPPSPAQSALIHMVERVLTRDH